MTDNNKLLVALVGRTNVGKSTLFNRLTERKQALVSPIENTTRDSNFGVVSWNNIDFQLVDTAGVIDIKYLLGSKQAWKKFSKMNSIEVKTQKQVGDFFKKAEVILFLVDNQTGMVTADREMALYLQQNPELRQKTLLVVNKVDSPRQRSEAAQFNRLGLGEPSLISATTGVGTGDLLDAVVKRLKKVKKVRVKKVKADAPVLDKINVCLIGKPNVGKSSLLNSILGYERVIVSEIPHTTREPQNTEMIYNDKLINLVDTAGISKHGHKSQTLEKYGMVRSWSTLKRSDIVLLMLDISQEITHQDAKIIEEIMEQGKSFIIIANKWDLIKSKDVKKYTQYIYGKLPFATWAPIQFISALTGSKVHSIFELIVKIASDRKIELSDSQLDHFLSRVVKIHRPARGKGVRHPRIYEFKQLKTNPPLFSIRIGAKEDLHFSYVRFLENRLREKYSFLGTPLKIVISKTPRIHGKADEALVEQIKAARLRKKNTKRTNK